MRSAHRENQQKPGADRVSRIARPQHLAPVESIRRMPGNQKQQNARKKLRQPHQAQVEGALGDVVNLPSHRDCLHFDGGHDEEARNLKQHEVRMREGDASGSGVGRCGHDLDVIF